MDTEEKRDLEELINKSVKKANRSGRAINFITKILIPLLIICAVVYGYYNLKNTMNQNFKVLEPVESHDLTLENHGIFGYTAADFEDVIVGKAKRQMLLIVDEQEVSVPSSITNSGFLNLGIFSKNQRLTLYGTGIYTIDLSKMTDDDITLDETTYTVQINVPYPELHTVNFDPTKTVVGDVNRGWLAFGDISLNAEQQKEFETTAVNKLTDRLNQDDCFDKAARYAKLSATELFQPVVEDVSPAYKVSVVVAQKPLENDNTSE